MSRMLWPTELRVQLAKLVAGARLELATFRVWTGCSSQLSYPAVFTILQWSGWQDLNLRPLDPKSSALPSCATSRNISSHRELFFNKMARPVGIEPATFWSVVKRSIQLSYGRMLLYLEYVYYLTTCFLKMQGLFSNFIAVCRIFAFPSASSFLSVRYKTSFCFAFLILQPIYKSISALFH